MGVVITVWIHNDDGEDLGFYIGKMMVSIQHSLLSSSRTHARFLLMINFWPFKKNFFYDFCFVQHILLLCSASPHVRVHVHGFFLF